MHDAAAPRSGAAGVVALDPVDAAEVGDGLPLPAADLVAAERAVVEQTAVAAPEAPASAQGGGGTGRLAREAAIYWAGVVARRVASLIMLPLYVRMLTPADYGVLQMLQISTDVVNIIIAGGLSTGVLRFYYKADAEPERMAVLSTAFLASNALRLVGALGLVAASPLVARYVFRDPTLAFQVSLAATTFFLGSLQLVPLAYMQATGRAMLSSVFSLVWLVLQLSLNAVMLVQFRLGVLGLQFSVLTCCLVFGVPSAVWMLRRTGLRFSRPAFADLRRFGTPYSVAMVASFMLTFGDRFFLQAYGTTTQVGLYGLAYQFGLLLPSLTTEPFMTAWRPARLRDLALPAAERDAGYNDAFFLLNALVVTAAVGIAAFSRPLLTLVAKDAYLPAAPLVGVIMLAYVLQAWTEVVELGVDASERTGLIATSTWVAGGVVVALYALLIPRFGPWGAAAATVAGFFTRFALMYRFAQRVYPIGWDVGTNARVALLGAAALLATTRWHPAGFAGQVGYGLLLTGAYAAAATAVVPARRRRQVAEAVRARAAGLAARLPGRAARA